MAMNVDSVLRLSAKVDGLNGIVAFNRGLQSVETTAKGVTGAMRGMTGAAAGLSGALGTLAPLLSVAGLVGMVQNTIKAGDAMYDLSQKTGVSVEALARFKKAAATSGTDLENVSKSLIKLSKSMLEANSGSANASKTFQALGINIKGSNGQLKTADAVMLEVANRFKAMPDGVAKTALALRLFGKSGAEMIPMLNMGGSAIESLSVKMTEAFAKKADEYSDKLAILSGKVGALGADLTIALLPALQSITDAVTSFVTAFNALPDVVKSAAVSGAALAFAWGPLTGIIRGVASGVAVFANGLEILRYQTALAGGVMPMLTGNVRALGAAILALPGWGWIAAGVTALGLLSKALYDNNMGFRNWVNNIGSVVANDFANSMKSLGDRAQKAIEYVKGLLPDLENKSQASANNMSNSFASAFKAMSANATSYFAAIGSTIARWWNQLNPTLRGILASQFSGSGAGLISKVVGYGVGASSRASAASVADMGRYAPGSAQKQFQPSTSSGNAMGSGFDPNLAALASGGGGAKSSKGRESQLQAINAANGLLRSQESIKARIAVAERTQNTSEKFRLEMVDRGVKLLAEAADIQREKISQADKDAKLQGIADRLQASQAQYGREIAGLQKQNIDALPFYVNELELITSEYGKNVEAAKQFTAEQEKQKQLADGIGNSIGQGMTSAFDALIAGSEEFGASLQKIASGVLMDIAKQLLQIYVINSAINAISSFFGPKTGGSSMFTPDFTAMQFAANGMVASNGIKPFAMGGIVSRPTLFKFASGGAGNLGLMGEAGPEAIMPLKRGRDGKLGVAGGGGVSVGEINITVQNTGENLSPLAQKQVATQVQNLVLATLANEKRSGGMLR